MCCSQVERPCAGRDCSSTLACGTPWRVKSCFVPCGLCVPHCMYAISLGVLQKNACNFAAASLRRTSRSPHSRRFASITCLQTNAPLDTDHAVDQQRTTATATTHDGPLHTHHAPGARAARCCPASCSRCQVCNMCHGSDGLGGRGCAPDHTAVRTPPGTLLCTTSTRRGWHALALPRPTARRSAGRLQVNALFGGGQVS